MTLRLPPVVDSFRVVNGKVRASQVLLYPVEPAGASDIADRIAALNTQHLVEIYADAITRWTHGLVRLVRRSGNLTLSLTTHGPDILSLRQKEGVLVIPGAVVVHLRIVGGLAAALAALDGILVLRLELRQGLSPTDVALEAEVLVDGYEPLLLTLPLPHRVRIALYRATQARLHRAITNGFVEALVRRVAPSPSSRLKLAPQSPA